MEKLPKISLLAACGGMLLYILLFLFVDRPVVGWLHAHHSEGWVHRLGEMISQPAGSPILEIGLALGLLTAVIGILSNGGQNRPWTTWLLYVCASCAAAIVIGEGLKILLGRYRPVMLFDHNLYGLRFFSTKWECTSTPSGHTVSAFSVLTALKMRFPRGRILLICLAVLIGISRVAVTAHYPGDVLFGALIGIFSALWLHRLFFPDRRVGGLNNRRIQGRGPAEGVSAENREGTDQRSQAAG
jgi:membrane-associated phospholipid phosphatase